MALNLNIGIMGHVDSGKTSLAKIMSHIASTAAFDKDPQSQRRGITLDLGFSACVLPIPEHLKTETNAMDIMFTLVDCPGHSSLIKTVIGGSHIIDMILLVIDIRKLIQAQTAECILIGEIIGCKMMVVLNKIDTIEEDKRQSTIEKAMVKIRKVLQTTTFTNVAIIPVAANPKDGSEVGIDKLVEQLLKVAFIPKRMVTGSCQFAVDHCFSIKGNGYVMTGTMLQGSISVNDEVYIEPINGTRKVKSIQVFRKPVTKICHGDRAAICVTNIESNIQINRALVCTPGLVHRIISGILYLNRIKYFKYTIEANSRFEVMIGHTMTMIKVTAIFSSVSKEFDINQQYKHVNSLDYNELDDTCHYFMLFEFSKPTAVIDSNLIIGFKADVPPNVCRIAFWGKIVNYSTDISDYKTTYFPKLKIFKIKRKEGIVERFSDENTAIVKQMFKKETDLIPFIGFSVTLSNGRIGKIESGFGKSGKVKVYLRPDNGEIVSADNGKISVLLEMKRFIFDSKKQLYQ